MQFLSFYFHIKSKTAFLETFSNLSNILLGCTHIHTGNFFHWSLEPNWRPVQIKVPFECNTVDKCFIHTNTVQCSMTQSKVPKTPEYIPQNVYFFAKLIWHQRRTNSHCHWKALIIHIIYILNSFENHASKGFVSSQIYTLHRQTLSHSSYCSFNPMLKQWYMYNK